MSQLDHLASAVQSTRQMGYRRRGEDEAMRCDAGTAFKIGFFFAAGVFVFSAMLSFALFLLMLATGLGLAGLRPH